MIKANICTGKAFLFTSLNKMADWEELGKFLVGLAGEIPNNVTMGLQDVGQSFTSQQVY